MSLSARRAAPYAVGMAASKPAGWRAEISNWPFGADHLVTLTSRQLTTANQDVGRVGEAKD
jgi:hypothetical protein